MNAGARFDCALSAAGRQHPAGEVVIAESQFVELFPSVSGYGFFLIETPRPRSAAGSCRGIWQTTVSKPR